MFTLWHFVTNGFCVDDLIVVYYSSVLLVKINNFVQTFVLVLTCAFLTPQINCTRWKTDRKVYCVRTHSCVCMCILVQVHKIQTDQGPACKNTAPQCSLYSKKRGASEKATEGSHTIPDKVLHGIILNSIKESVSIETGGAHCVSQSCTDQITTLCSVTEQWWNTDQMTVYVQVCSDPQQGSPCCSQVPTQD